MAIKRGRRLPLSVRESLLVRREQLLSQIQELDEFLTSASPYLPTKKAPVKMATAGKHPTKGKKAKYTKRDKEYWAKLAGKGDK